MESVQAGASQDQQMMQYTQQCEFAEGDGQLMHICSSDVHT